MEFRENALRGFTSYRWFAVGKGETDRVHSKVADSVPAPSGDNVKIVRSSGLKTMVFFEKLQLFRQFVPIELFEQSSRLGLLPLNLS